MWNVAGLGNICCWFFSVNGNIAKGIFRTRGVQIIAYADHIVLVSKRNNGRNIEGNGGELNDLQRTN